MVPYKDAVAFLESFIDFERHRGKMKYNTRVLHVRRFEKFLRTIGSPHTAVRVVHLAGTKGKGSTAAILHSIAVEAGLRSGLYVSPHLQSYCERIQIDRAPVSKRAFARAVESLRQRMAQFGHAPEPGYRTTFELLTALAFDVFRSDKVDLAVVETGLGGRLDATNVVRPEVSVITSIGLDHTHLLGETHAAIAGEKAGIVKPDRPTVLARQDPAHFSEILAAVRAACAKQHSPLYYAPRWVDIESRRITQSGQIVRCGLRRSATELDISLPLPGSHQAENLRTALATVEILRAGGWPIPDEAIRAGAANVRWPGRFERLAGTPPLILDGAHCPLSVQALVHTLRETAGALRPVFLFSLLDDKSVEPILEPLRHGFRGGEIVVFRAPSVRGRDPETLREPLAALGFRATVAPTAAGAVRKALERAQPPADCVLAAFGTLYSIEPLRKAYRRLTPQVVRK